MKKNTLIIGGAVAVVIIAVAVFMIMRQPEEPVVNNVTNITINPVTTPTNVITQTLTGTMETGAAVVLTSNVATTFGSVTYPTVTTWSVDATLVEGSNTITATATDEAGNIDTATVTIVLAEVPVDPVVNDVIDPFVPDMTIEAEFCRTVITKAQLREITGHQGDFMFTEWEDDDPVFGFIRSCEIQAEMMEIAISISITDLNFETMINEIRLEEPEIYAMMDELDNVGEKAVIATMDMGILGVIYMIAFSDREIDQSVGVDGIGLTREDIINLARQVEANIR